MSVHLLNLVRYAIAAGVLMLVPLPAALALAPVHPDPIDAELMADGVQIPDLGDDRWDAPDPAWPFGIPHWPEDPGVRRADDPVQLSGDNGHARRPR